MMTELLQAMPAAGGEHEAVAEAGAASEAPMAQSLTAGLGRKPKNDEERAAPGGGGLDLEASDESSALPDVTGALSMDSPPWEAETKLGVIKLKGAITGKLVFDPPKKGDLDTKSTVSAAKVKAEAKSNFKVLGFAPKANFEFENGKPKVKLGGELTLGERKLPGDVKAELKVTAGAFQWDKKDGFKLAFAEISEQLKREIGPFMGYNGRAELELKATAEPDKEYILKWIAERYGQQLLAMVSVEGGLLASGLLAFAVMAYAWAKSSEPGDKAHKYALGAFDHARGFEAAIRGQAMPKAKASEEQLRGGFIAGTQALDERVNKLELPRGAVSEQWAKEGHIGELGFDKAWPGVKQTALQQWEKDHNWSKYFTNDAKKFQEFLDLYTFFSMRSAYGLDL